VLEKLSLANGAFGGEARSVGGGPGIGLRTFLGRVTLAAALGLELRWTLEHLVRPDAARAMAAGLLAAEDRSSGGVGPRTTVRAALPLGHELTLSAAASLTGLVRDDVSANGLADTTL